MAVEFRQRTASEIWKMIRRRKWYVLLPTLTVGIAVGWVVFNLPNYYESTTVLTLKPPTISEKVVQSLSDEDLSARLQTINQEVLSRSSLEPMIGKYGLFELEKDSGMPMELLVDKMRKNISVELVNSENDRKVAGFRITYRDRSPTNARNVTAELASKYVNAQVAASMQNAETTREFIETQTNQARLSLEAVEAERLKIMQTYRDTLPEAAQGLIAQLDGLRRREETISKEKESLTVEKGRLNDSIRSLNQQMRIIEDFGEKETQSAVSQAQRIEDTPAYAQLIQKRAELTASLEKLKTQYREKHPAVLDVKTQIEKVNDELENLSKNTERRVKEAGQVTARRADLQKQNILIDIKRAESQIAQVDQQVQSKDEEFIRNQGQIARLEAKINTIPNVRVALEAINNQYQTAKQSYEVLQQKRNDAQLQVERESSAQGETIRVVDAANLPSSPVNASKKPMFILVGFGIGFLFGLLLASVFEIPRWFRIQNLEDAKHYTGLPILAIVPPLLTHTEIAWQNRRHWLKVMAGCAASLSLIPFIIMVIQGLRIFEKLGN